MKLAQAHSLVRFKNSAYYFIIKLHNTIPRERRGSFWNLKSGLLKTSRSDDRNTSWKGTSPHPECHLPRENRHLLVTHTSPRKKKKEGKEFRNEKWLKPARISARNFFLRYPPSPTDPFCRVRDIFEDEHARGSAR